MKRVTIDLPPDLYAELKEYTVSQDRPISGVVRSAIREWLDKQLPR